MAENRLEPLNLTDFTGGLNLRRDQFTLAENESPDMLNVDVDPRGGFYTRQGWRRWNDSDFGAYAPGDPWMPMNGASHVLAAGDQMYFIVESNTLYVVTNPSTNAVLTGIVAEATPHGADFVSWRDDVYIACGMLQPGIRYEPDGTVITLGTTFSEVDAPTGNTMPHAEYAEAHNGYLFVACTMETSNPHFARVRWSHPNRPDAWRDLDYIDIDAGGGRITGIMSFLDHLLIFKTNSLWALYGYDDSSWQLVKISNSIGCPSSAAMTRSETAAYFYSSSNNGGIYLYTGSQPMYLTEKVAVAFEDIGNVGDVCVSWANRRLWISVPWHSTAGPMTTPTTLLVYNPDVGDGAWTQYRSDFGAVTCVITGSDINSQNPLALFASNATAALVELDAIDDAYDEILLPSSLGVTPDGYLVTSLDEEILVTVDDSRQLFDSYYRTRWLHAGWPDRRKSWRRPTFICRRVPRQVDLLVQQYNDYDETTIRRTGVVQGIASEGAMWGETGLEWGDGAVWGAQSEGASMIRSASMGHAAAVQMKVTAAPYTSRRKWGVDGVIVKFTTQRFRT